MGHNNGLKKINLGIFKFLSSLMMELLFLMLGNDKLLDKRQPLPLTGPGPFHFSRPIIAPHLHMQRSLSMLRQTLFLCSDIRALANALLVLHSYACAWTHMGSEEIV